VAEANKCSPRQLVQRPEGTCTESADRRQGPVDWRISAKLHLVTLSFVPRQSAQATNQSSVHLPLATITLLLLSMTNAIHNSSKSNATERNYRL